MDAIKALKFKKQQLNSEMSDIQLEYKKKIQLKEQEIAEIDNAISLIQELLSQHTDDIVCKECKGSGTVWKYDAAGDRETIFCPKCSGKGFVKVIK